MGVSLLAKASGQPLQRRLTYSFREQARSHKKIQRLARLRVEAPRVSKGGSQSYKPRNQAKSIRRQHPTPHLVALDGFEQRLEVALAEAVVALALDELKKHRSHQGFREDLQQQALVAAF